MSAGIYADQGHQLFLVDQQWWVSIFSWLQALQACLYLKFMAVLLTNASNGEENGTIGNCTRNL
jgi:hypothetical protein